MHRERCADSADHVQADLYMTAQESWATRWRLAKSRLQEFAGDGAGADGTIGFMMDCRHEGIEPDLALVEVTRNWLAAD